MEQPPSALTRSLPANLSISLPPNSAPGRRWWMNWIRQWFPLPCQTVPIPLPRQLPSRWKGINWKAFPLCREILAVNVNGEVQAPAGPHRRDACGSRNQALLPPFMPPRNRDTLPRLFSPSVPCPFEFRSSQKTRNSQLFTRACEELGAFKIKHLT